ncbi:hypothetical protein PFISCL1PPCAC_9647, partial [Pristionchus fissidentatus]
LSKTSTMRRQQPHAQCFDGIASINDVKKCIKHGHSVLILMRGPPGSGKTHLANELVLCRTVDEEDTRKPVVLSTDRFFMTPNGRYAFDNTRLDEFHKKNQNDAKAAMENNQSPVIIDNTNMQVANMKTYISHAIKSCYEIYILEPTTPWKHDSRQLAKMNKHFVDELRIASMIAAFEKIERFADLLKPVPFVVNRVEFSSDEEEDSSGPLHNKIQPLLSLNICPPRLSNLCMEQRSLNGCISTAPPPGLGPPPAADAAWRGPPVQHLQLQQQRQPSPIFSMNHESLISVQQRDVGCQATPGVGLLVEAEIKEEDIPPDVAAMCCSEHEERVAQRRRGAETRDACTDTPCSPDQIAFLSTAFPTVSVDDLEMYAVEYPAYLYYPLLIAAGAELDCVAPLPWLPEDSDNSQKGKKSRQKDAPGGFMLTPKSTPKKKAAGASRVEEMTGYGEGCGTPWEDQTSASASLSNSNSLEERGEPLAAAFGEDELIVLDIHQPIKNLLELFFGHNTEQPDVHMPLWLLRMVHRAARGERLTKGTLYHEEYPSIDLCGLADEEVAMQQQMRDDAEIARLLHAQETMRESASITDSFTPDQIHHVRTLRAKYPAADPESVAEIFKTMRFDLPSTLTMLSEQFGEAAHILPTPAHALPAAVLAPPPLPTQPASRATSATNQYQQQLQYSQRAQQGGRVSTHQGNGRITDVGRMAAANGASMSQVEVQNEFARLHERRAELQKKLDEVVKQGQSVREERARGYYSQQIRKAKADRIEVDNEIKELGKWWNENLNSDVIDLHFMLAEHAMQMFREKIAQVKANIRRGGTRRLTVITGSGNNSIGGTSEIKKRVMALIHAQKYQHHHNNNGCVIINF